MACTTANVVRVWRRVTLTCAIGSHGSAAKALSKVVAHNQFDFWSRYTDNKLVVKAPLAPAPPAPARAAAPSGAAARAVAVGAGAVGASAACVVAGGVAGAGVSATVVSVLCGSVFAVNASAASSRKQNRLTSSAATKEKAAAKLKAEKESKAAAGLKDKEKEKEKEEEDGSAAKEVQRRVTGVLHGLLLDELIADSPLSSAARVTNCSLRNAWRWLLVCPVERCFVLTDTEMRSALRHQYGLGAVGDGLYYCKCGASMEAGHPHVCNRVSGPSTFARHEAVVSELSAAAEAHAQLSVARQPAMAFVDRVAAGEAAKKSSRVVPDILFDGPAFTCATDVSVVYGEAKSHLPSALKGVRKQAMKECKAREGVKHQKYAQSCKAMGASFVPFVVESHGYLGNEAVKLINSLAHHASEVMGVEEKELAGYLQRRVAVAVQRGNAWLDRTAMQRSRNSFGAAVAMGMVSASSVAAVNSRSMASAAKKKRSARKGAASSH